MAGPSERGGTSFCCLLVNACSKEFLRSKELLSSKELLCSNELLCSKGWNSRYKELWFCCLVGRKLLPWRSPSCHKVGKNIKQGAMLYGGHVKATTENTQVMLPDKGKVMTQLGIVKNEPGNLCTTRMANTSLPMETNQDFLLDATSPSQMHPEVRFFFFTYVKLSGHVVAFPDASRTSSFSFHDIILKSILCAPARPFPYSAVERLVHLCHMRDAEACFYILKHSCRVRIFDNGDCWRLQNSTLVQHF